MLSRHRRLLLATVVLLAPGALAPAHGGGGGTIDIGFEPDDRTVARCATVEIDLVVSAAGAGGELFDALDAILSWDPAVLEFIEIDDSNAEANFFISDFLPDPDGINDDVTDGEALYTALAPAGNPVEAPPRPDDLIVTTFVFKAIAFSPGTDLELIPVVGNFGRTRVLFEGQEITGAINDVATTQVGTCPGDVDINGAVEFLDILNVLDQWGGGGPCEDGCCPADLDGDGDVDFSDLLIVLVNWGPCP